MAPRPHGRKGGDGFVLPLEQSNAGLFERSPEFTAGSFGEGNLFVRKILFL